MPESVQHRTLVSRIVRAIADVFHGRDDVLCLVDGTPDSDEVPHMIGGYRPDVYAFAGRIVVVGEAKPTWDVESARTQRQLQAFMAHVEANSCRHLVLAVDWTTAVTARSVLRNAASDWSKVRGRVHLLDGVTRLSLPGEESTGA